MNASTEPSKRQMRRPIQFSVADLYKGVAEYLSVIAVSFCNRLNESVSGSSGLSYCSRVVDVAG